MFRRNVIANFFGRAWPNLLALLFVPVYIRYLGIEAYGLIGFFTALQATISFLDLGLSTTAKREMSIRQDEPHLVDETRNIVRTLEVVYGFVALLIALFFLLSAGWVADHWISAENLQEKTVETAVLVFGITLALRWPVALYGGVILGLERQVLFNVLNAIISTFRSIGAVLVIVFWSPSILVFLFWQLGAALIEFVMMAYTTWAVLPQSQTTRQAKFDVKILRRFWQFSAALSLNSIMAAVLKQADRILLSGLMPLQSVGYYSTAYSAHTGLGMLHISISEAAFPQFSNLIAKNKIEELADNYHKACQYMSFIVTPIVSMVFYFSYDILLFWTRSSIVAKNAAWPLSLLALAYGLNAMMRLPWRLQLAYGITRLMLISNLVSLMIIFPTMYFLIGKYGVNGAGIGWAILNAGYYLIVPHWVHKIILPTHKWRWFFYDTLLFMLLSWFIFGIAYLVNITWHNLLLSSITLGIASMLYIFLCYKLYPTIRFFWLDIYRLFLLNN